nr:hypothetical protein StreXyl84_24690 [Streptomyces sp. Xyl84]
MTYRCEETIMLDPKLRDLAAQIPSPFGGIEWAIETEGQYAFQCKLEDAPHDYHAAFLRTGAFADPCTDVFLCWVDGGDEQWLEDIEVCMKRRKPLDSGCTIFRKHPGKCDWEYIDPPLLAAKAQADQLMKEPGLNALSRALRGPGSI